MIDGMICWKRYMWCTDYRLRNYCSPHGLLFPSFRTFQEFSQEDPYCGQLSVGLMFSPKKTVQTTLGTQTKGHLHILIKQAKELPIRDAHGLTDATVKCYLLPNRKSSGKKKTQVIKNSLNPVWEEQFTYQVTREELSKDRVLEITVWDYDRRGTNDFIGGLLLGPARAKGKNKEWMDCTGDELSHWEDMLERPGEWVELWHTLRPSLEHSKYPSTADGFSPVLKALSDPATPPITGEDETPVSKVCVLHPYAVVVCCIAIYVC